MLSPLPKPDVCTRVSGVGLAIPLSRDVGRRQHNIIGRGGNCELHCGERDHALAHPPGSGRDADGTEVRRRAIVANRQQMLVDVIARLLADEGIEIVGTALAAEETIALAEGTRPDLAVIGLTLDRAENIEILSRLRTTNPNLKIVALSSSEDEIRFALAGGADACLSESAEPDDIRVVVRQVARQSIYLAPSDGEAGSPETAADPS